MKKPRYIRWYRLIEGSFPEGELVEIHHQLDMKIEKDRRANDEARFLT